MYNRRSFLAFYPTLLISLDSPKVESKHSSESSVICFLLKKGKHKALRYIFYFVWVKACQFIHLTWKGAVSTIKIPHHISHILLWPMKVRLDHCGKSCSMRTWVCTDYRLEGNQLYYGIKKGRIVTPQANITFVETEWLVGKIIIIRVFSCLILRRSRRQV